MSATETIDSGVAMARIASVEVAGPLSVRITWAEGERAGRSETIDLAPVIGRYRIYRRLREDAALFATVRIAEDGFTIAWDGEDLEMTADLVEQCADETMTPAEFAGFLKRNGLTQEAAAALLGRSRRQVGYYLKPGPVPRIVALACIGYEALKARGQKVA